MEAQEVQELQDARDVAAIVSTTPCKKPASAFVLDDNERKMLHLSPDAVVTEQHLDRLARYYEDCVWNEEYFVYAFSQLGGRSSWRDLKRVRRHLGTKRFNAAVAPVRARWKRSWAEWPPEAEANAIVASEEAAAFYARLDDDIPDDLRNFKEEP